TGLDLQHRRFPELPVWKNDLFKRFDISDPKCLATLRQESLANRKVRGPRGSLDAAADPVDQVRLIQERLQGSVGPLRNEIVLCMGEWGGEEQAVILKSALERALTENDEEHQFHLVSALTAIGGPTAVDGLFIAAERGKKDIQLAALSGIEGLASD